MAPHLRHTLDYMESPKRGGVQGSNPLRGCSSARSEGPSLLMEPSWLRHLGPCTPIDSCFLFFQSLIQWQRGGVPFWGPFSLFKKKKKIISYKSPIIFPIKFEHHDEKQP